MALKREASCPLCGARLTPQQVLDACEELVDAGHGVLGCRCPYCQGYFEVMPQADSVAIGYLRHGRFDTVLALPCTGLTVELGGDTLRVEAAGRNWTFAG